jgi:CRP-like cAMP-binding protein
VFTPSPGGFKTNYLRIQTLILTTSPPQSYFLTALKTAMEAYNPISDDSWQKLSLCCELIPIDKQGFFTQQGEIPNSFGFVYSGLLRSYITDDNGNEYNKIFFPENTFPGSMAALLAHTPSQFFIEALEDSKIVQINHQGFRRLLETQDDLKWFHIRYLEKNWLIDKEKREIALVQQSATQRYLAFKQEHPHLEARISQYHIASHLGITPTQLSRIRKSLS